MLKPNATIQRFSCTLNQGVAGVLPARFLPLLMDAHSHSPWLQPHLRLNSLSERARMDVKVLVMALLLARHRRALGMPTGGLAHRPILKP